MSVRSGLQSFVVPLNIAAAATDAVTQFAIPVYKGTYIISLTASIVCTVAPNGVIVSLQTTNAVPPGAVATIIFRNTDLAANATLSLPAGATTTQPVSLQSVYTFPSDTTCYLNIGTNGAGGETYTLAASGAINTITFTQIAY